MSQAILNQIVNQLEMLDFFELQELERAIEKYLADKQQATQQKPTQKFVNKKQLFQEWDAISDEEAAVLKAEFTTDYVSRLQVALQYTLQMDEFENVE
ncbi:hypothetical protein [Microcoleus sp. EPA2]|uniref:hypothetical protein n=1 Tax=Microcoleus sp. EPA2 TaxID=2841654 RepID=UPI00312BC060